MGESIYDAVHPSFKFTYFTAKGVPEMHGQSFNPNRLGRLRQNWYTV